MMTRRTFGTLVFAAVAAVSWKVFAHEGHEHRVMGTVSTIHEHHLEVNATDGKTVAFVLNDKTKVLRGTNPAKLADIKTGERVVIVAVETKEKSGKMTIVVKEVRLGASGK